MILATDKKGGSVYAVLYLLDVEGSYHDDVVNLQFFVFVSCFIPCVPP